MYNIATTATSKSRRRNRTLPSVIWRGPFLSPSPTFQMNPQVHLPPLRPPCSPPPRPPHHYYSLAVTFDRKIKRSDLNVAITRPRVSTCSYIQWVPVPPKFFYRLRTGQRSNATLLIANVLNSTKSQRIDLSIYPDKALRRRIRLVTA